MLELAAITNYKQLPNVYVKKQDKTVRVKMNFIQNQVYITTKEVAVGQVLYEFQETFEHNLSHFNVERIQQREFLNDLRNPGSYITQTDFAQAYQLSYKRRQWEHLRVEEV